MFSKTILSALLLLLSPLAFAQDDCDTEIEEIGVECPDALGSLVRCLLRYFFFQIVATTTDGRQKL